jgi:hypothetical protein
MSNFGIRVIKNGKLPRNTDPTKNPVDSTQKDLNFTTLNNTFRYTKMATIKNIVPGTYANDAARYANPQLIQVPHGLGYAPSFLVYAYDTTTGVLHQPLFDGTSVPTVVAYGDTVNLNFIIHTAPNPFDLIYFIGGDDLDSTDS